MPFSSRTRSRATAALQQATGTVADLAGRFAGQIGARLAERSPAETWAAPRSSAARSARRPDIDRRPGPRIVILGAGFGGLNVALELGRHGRDGLAIDVTLVDRANYHLFTPMLYQVATGLIEPGHVSYPTRSLARRYGFRFRESRIEGIDLETRTVRLDDGLLGYDYLVIALGSTTNYFGMASAQQNAASLKTLGDAIDVRNRVVEAFERADVETDPEARRSLLTFVVVGGGATGVELVGSLHTLIRNGLLPDFPSIHREEVRLVLAEAAPTLLNGMPAELGAAATRRLAAKGVELRLGSPATEVTARGITFKDGTRLDSRTVVWAAGVRPAPLATALTVEKSRDGRLVVDPYLRLPSHPDVFALGDCAAFAVAELGGRPAPPNAQTAVRQAPVVAHNIAAAVRGAQARAFHYANEGSLVALGQGDGVAILGPLRLEGLPAWLTWRGFYLNQLMGFKNRAGVLVEWASAYLGHRSTARLDVSTTRDTVGRPAGPPRADRPAPTVPTERAAETSPVPAPAPSASASPPARAAR